MCRYQQRAQQRLALCSHACVLMLRADKSAGVLYGHPGSMVNAGLSIYMGADKADGTKASRTGKSRWLDHQKDIHCSPGTLASGMPAGFLSKEQEMSTPCEDMKPMLNAHGLVFDDTLNGRGRQSEAQQQKPVFISGNVLKKTVPGNARHLKLNFHLKNGSLIDTYSRIKNIFVALNRPFHMDPEEDAIWNRTEVTPFPRQGFDTQELVDAAVSRDECAPGYAFVTDPGRVEADKLLKPMTFRYLVDRLVGVLSGRSEWAPRAPVQQQATEAFREELRKASRASPAYGHDDAMRAVRRLLQLRLNPCAPEGDIDETMDPEAAARRKQLDRMAFQRAATGKRACFCKKAGFHDACHFRIVHLFQQLKVQAPAAHAYWTRLGMVEFIPAVQNALGLEHMTIPPKHNKSIRNGIWGWKLVPEGESGTDGTPWDTHIETAEGMMVQEDEDEADAERAW